MNCTITVHIVAIVMPYLMSRNGVSKTQKFNNRLCKMRLSLIPISVWFLYITHFMYVVYVYVWCSDFYFNTFFLLVLFFRSSLYKALDGELPDLAMLRVSEVYKDFPPSLAPLVTTMGMSADVPLVQSAFGAVQAGSVLSFQQKPPAMREVINIPSAPASPTLPIHSYRLEPPSCAYVLSEQEHLHLKSLEVSFNMAHRIEAATQGQSLCQEWHRLRKMRVTSTRFHEVCHVRGHTSAENLAERILRGTGQTTDMRRGIDMEPLAVKEY